MRKFAFLAPGLLLSACGGGAEEAPEEAVVEDEAMVEADVEFMAADGNPPEGTYEITTAEGETYTQEVSEDGTYTNTHSDGTIETGTWRLEDANTWCSTPEGEEETCYNEMIDAEGNWTSTDPEDPADQSIVERVEA